MFKQFNKKKSLILNLSFAAHCAVLSRSYVHIVKEALIMKLALGQPRSNTFFITQKRFFYLCFLPAKQETCFMCWPFFLNYLTEIPKHKRYKLEIILGKYMQDWSFAVCIYIRFEAFHVLNGYGKVQYTRSKFILYKRCFMGGISNQNMNILLTK